MYAGGKHLATYDGGATGSMYFNATDWLGNERVRTPVTGPIVETCTNLPFGDDLVCTGTETSALHFTGKERDSESGNDYFGARYYSSSSGRWMSPDSDESPEALPYSDLDDPQTIDLYAYVRDSPVSSVDPDGHMSCKQSPDDPGTLICEPDPPSPPKENPPAKPPTEDSCEFLCQEVFHSVQAQRTWDLSARVTNRYIADPLLAFLSFTVPGALEAAGPTVETSVGTAIVSAGTKGAARQAVEGTAISTSQKAAVKRAIARATASERVSVERLADGSIRVLRARPGADGYQVFSTVVSQSGASNVVQVGVTAAGEVTHYDPK
jgi:RHS repeat-associated protein